MPELSVIGLATAFAAGAIPAAIPALGLFLTPQRHIVGGLTAGSGKG